MRIKLLFFAGLREALGTDREELELPRGVETAGALRAHLVARGGAWAQALDTGRAVRIAVDQALATPESRIQEGAEVAFFPPVTGG